MLFQPTVVVVSAATCTWVRVVCFFFSSPRFYVDFTFCLCPNANRYYHCVCKWGTKITTTSTVVLLCLSTTTTATTTFSAPPCSRTHAHTPKHMTFFVVVVVLSSRAALLRAQHKLCACFARSLSLSYALQTFALLHARTLSSSRSLTLFRADFILFQKVVCFFRSLARSLSLVPTTFLRTDFHGATSPSIAIFLLITIPMQGV